MNIISVWLGNFDFIKYGFCNNHWVWAHILIAAFLTRILSIYFKDFKVYLYLFLMALGFEFIEYIFEGVEPYGSSIIWFYDSLGDVIGAVVISIIILIRKTERIRDEF